MHFVLTKVHQTKWPTRSNGLVQISNYSKFYLFYVHIIKTVYDKPTANIILSATGSPRQCNLGKKAIRIGKEEVKLSLFTDDMTLYTPEYPKDLNKNC